MQKFLVCSQSGRQFCTAFFTLKVDRYSSRLDNALVLANEFDSAVKTELRILKDFEDTLRGLGPISEDLDTIGEQLVEHKVYCHVICRNREDHL